MKLIEDLGLLEYGKQGRKRQFGLYECSCGIQVKVRTSYITNNNITICISCANKAKAAVAKSEFFSKANAVHGKYSYGNVTYINALTKVAITCPIHGDFLQTPSSHLNKHGCPSCAVTGFNKTKSGILYYLKVTSNNTIAYKIGITNRTIQERYSNSDRSKIIILKMWEYPLGIDAYTKERQIIKLYKDFLYTGDPLLDNGNTELFILDVLDLDFKEN